MRDLDYYYMLKLELEKRISMHDEEGACEILGQIDNLERQLFPSHEEVGCSLPTIQAIKAGENEHLYRCDENACNGISTEYTVGGNVAQKIILNRHVG